MVTETKIGKTETSLEELIKVMQKSGIKHLDKDPYGNIYECKKESVYRKVYAYVSSNFTTS